ncbi:peptidoglycan-associated lipoprotein Pal [Lichenifustis flavocetrariae]|uniref:Peptidoglycan-associated protein n=1 Tax=Lichenifustis flavocetrariae TaxID=2949735 RepID=A0AA42CMD5_9HYPH|nr:peptidoglycan-associated lipoprotein Pal [Lichenifustis flavocetrariae]MCW6508240.1 peptidoglycan-associated lipoprotein Pal [Lichenifustis flavocetrariae]
MQPFTSLRLLKFAALLSAGLALTACAKNGIEDAALGGGGLGTGSGAGMATPGSVQDFAVNVGDRVFFESDQTTLSQTAQATLDKQAVWLARYGNYAFTIEGHADERGTREYNFALGSRRADAVKEYLVAKGIPAARMHTISYGKERPVATCNDISCWSQNRRAVTVLNGGQS